MARMRAVDTLVRTRSDDHHDAFARRDRLVLAARILVVAAAHAPDVERCADAGCGLAGITIGPEVCTVAHGLARLDADTPAGTMALRDALVGFRGALLAGLAAVRTCRQTVHPVGGCWFGTGTARDGCAAVLRLGHRLG